MCILLEPVRSVSGVCEGVVWEGGGCPSRWRILSARPGSGCMLVLVVLVVGRGREPPPWETASGVGVQGCECGSWVRMGGVSLKTDLQSWK